MKYIPNAMRNSAGTQSRPNSSILNMIFENCGSWPEIKNLGRFGLKIAMCSNFYKIWHLVQIENANFEYSTWNWRSWPKNSFQPLTIITKCSILDVAAALDPPLNMLIMNITLASIYSVQWLLITWLLEIDYRLRMIIGCKIRLSQNMINCFNSTLK